MLDLSTISTGYGKAPVLFDVSFSVGPGEVVCLLGRNGAGKSTVMKAVMGLIPLWSGGITMDGHALGALPSHKVASCGLGYIPQGRRLFKELTVQQNLDIGLMASSGGSAALDRSFTLFPRLKDRRDQRAETLSGGEQQMLATARALCTNPKVLLLDEPSEGLQPSMIAQIRAVIEQMRAENMGVLLVEQRIETVLAIADRVVVLETGRVVKEANIAELRADPGVLNHYLGV